jgi:hypothetical protein
MGYFSEMDIELQDDWQSQQAKDEEQEAEEMAAFVNSGSVVVVPSDILDSELDDPFNEFGSTDFDAVLGAEEMRHIECQAEIQENIHNGYGNY